MATVTLSSVLKAYARKLGVRRKLRFRGGKPYEPKLPKVVMPPEVKEEVADQAKQDQPPMKIGKPHVVLRSMEKAYNDDLGGDVSSYTESGKPILGLSHPAHHSSRAFDDYHAGWTAADHAEAYRVHAGAARRATDEDEQAAHTRVALRHLERANPNSFYSVRKSARLVRSKPAAKTIGTTGRNKPVYPPTHGVYRELVPEQLPGSGPGVLSHNLGVMRRHYWMYQRQDHLDAAAIHRAAGNDQAAQAHQWTADVMGRYQIEKAHDAHDEYVRSVIGLTGGRVVGQEPYRTTHSHEHHTILQLPSGKYLSLQTSAWQPASGRAGEATHVAYHHDTPDGRTTPIYGDDRPGYDRAVAAIRQWHQPVEKAQRSLGKTSSGKRVAKRRAPNRPIHGIRGKDYTDWEQKDFAEAAKIYHGKGDTHGRHLHDHVARAGVIGHSSKGHPVVADWEPHKYIGADIQFHHDAADLHEAQRLKIAQDYFGAPANKRDRSLLQLGARHRWLRDAHRTKAVNMEAAKMATKKPVKKALTDDTWDDHMQAWSEHGPAWNNSPEAASTYANRVAASYQKHVTASHGSSVGRLAANHAYGAALEAWQNHATEARQNRSSQEGSYAVEGKAHDYILNAVRTGLPGVGKAIANLMVRKSYKTIGKTRSGKPIPLATDAPFHDFGDWNADDHDDAAAAHADYAEFQDSMGNPKEAYNGRTGHAVHTKAAQETRAIIARKAVASPLVVFAVPVEKSMVAKAKISFKKQGEGREHFIYADGGFNVGRIRTDVMGRSHAVHLFESSKPASVHGTLDEAKQAAREHYEALPGTTRREKRDAYYAVGKGYEQQWREAERSRQGKHTTYSSGKQIPDASHEAYTSHRFGDYPPKEHADFAGWTARDHSQAAEHHRAQAQSAESASESAWLRAGGAGAKDSSEYDSLQRLMSAHHQASSYHSDMAKKLRSDKQRAKLLGGK